MTTRAATGLVLLGAVLLVASYPPFRLPPLSFLALVPAALLLRHAIRVGDVRWAFRWGFRYGLAAHGLVLYWLVVALWHFTPLAALGYAITVTILGLFTGAVFWLVARSRLRWPRLPLALLLPAVWTAFEWMLGHLGDVAFPWLGLGVSLGDAPVLIQWADVAGAHGVTFWLAWCAVVIAAVIPVSREERAQFAPGPAVRRLAPVVVSIVIAVAYGVRRERTLVQRPLGVVGLIQPNEGFREKWDPAHADSVVATLLNLSRRVRTASRPDLLVWPEAALPDLLEQEPRWDMAVGRLGAEGHTPIVTGGLDVEMFSGGYTIYNAAFYYDSTGDRRRWPVYRKRYLVPVVERVPFVPVAWFRRVPWLRKWSGGFGRGQDLPIYQSGIGRFGVLVCYEAIFEDLARRYRRAGADFLVNVTNDAWYGRTAGPYQHVTHLVMRAIETRMGIARAANSGISEVIDPLGYPHAATALEVQTAVAARLTTSDVVPLYVRLGDWVGWACGLVTAALAAGQLAPRTARRAPLS